MKTGQCPKCNNQTVYKKTENGISYGSAKGVYVYTSAVTMPSGSEDYICTTCGYFERYIIDREKLDAVAKKWDKVG